MANKNSPGGMTKAKAVKFWKEAQGAAMKKDAIKKFASRNGYPSERTLERLLQLDEGFRAGLTLEAIAKSAQYTDKTIERYRKWWDEWQEESRRGQSVPTGDRWATHQADLAMELERLLRLAETQPLAPPEPTDEVARQTRQALWRHLRGAPAAGLAQEWAAARQGHLQAVAETRLELAAEQVKIAAALPDDAEVTNWADTLLRELEGLAGVEEEVWRGLGPFPRLSYPDVQRSYSIRPDEARPGQILARWGEIPLNLGGVALEIWEAELRPRHEALAALAWRRMDKLKEKRALAKGCAAALAKELATLLLRRGLPGRCEFCPAQAPSTGGP